MTVKLIFTKIGNFIEKKITKTFSDFNEIWYVDRGR